MSREVTREFYSLPDIVKITGKHISTVHAWVTEGPMEKRLPAYKLGGNYLVRIVDWEAFVQNRKVKE